MTGLDYLRFVFAFLVVLGLIGVGALALRRLAAKGFSWSGIASGMDRQLRVRDLLVLDSRRKIIRVANGKRQYVLLLSQNGETLVDNYVDNHSENYTENNAPKTRLGARPSSDSQSRDDGSNSAELRPENARSAE